jgi:hypothetical protein
VPHLEALMLLLESAPKQWTAEELAARLYVDVEAAKRIVSDFTRYKLVVASGAGHAYVAQNEQAAIVPLVAQTYRRQLVQVTRFIHSKGSPAMQEFARAFRFKHNER